MNNLPLYNMIEQQIKPWNISNEEVLSVIEGIDRVNFVPKKYKNLAYADTNIPLPNNQVMLEPKFVAKALEFLQITSTDNVLEIGTGSGYLTAMLSKLASHVTSYEISQEIHQFAYDNLKPLSLNNVQLINSNAYTGLKGLDSFDKIVVTGACKTIPAVFVRQCMIGGKIFMVIGNDSIQQAGIGHRTESCEMKFNPLFETVVPFLIGESHNSDFIF